MVSIVTGRVKLNGGVGSRQIKSNIRYVMKLERGWRDLLVGRDVQPQGVVNCK